MQKTTLITGASSGIGSDLARLFASDGHNLLLVARSLDKLNALKAELESKHPIKVTVFAKDLTQPSAAQAVFTFAQNNDITVDILVNNAGFGDWGLFSESSLQKQRELIQLNIAALTELTHYFLKPMISQKSGKILNVASIASFMPGPKMSVYYASKAYVRSFTEALSVELKGTGVTTTALCPGPVKTAFWKVAQAENSSLSRHMFFAESGFIARYGYKCLMRGKVLAIPGFSVRAAVLLTKLLPRSLVRNLVYKVQK